MTTGYLAAGKCWPTSSDAVDAYYSNQQPLSWPLNNNYYLERPVKVSGVWRNNEQNLNTGVNTTSTYALPTNVYGTCTLEEPPQPYPTTLTCTNCGGGSGIPSTGTGWDGTYDYAIGTAAWTFAFITIMGCWLIAKHAGEILDFINRPTR